MYSKYLNYVFLISWMIAIDLLGKGLDKNEYLEKLWFKTEPLSEILKFNPQISYHKFMDKIYFDYPEFLNSLEYPHKGYFEELFCLTIPEGKVQGCCGYFFIDGKFANEMIRANRYDFLIFIKKIPEENCFKIPGTMAVIAQHGASGIGGANYYHTICEVFGRLALLEMNNIEYDWLYVPTSEKFMREALDLWGIDSQKIISLEDENYCVQADTLIVPSLIINTSAGHNHSGNFQHPVLLKYVREKLLHSAEKKGIDTSKFSKRIFITRKDTSTNRKIINEDEVYALFKEKGFERYTLSELSVTEQILLFNNAEIVVSEQGTGLANILFCKSGTQVIEIFQYLIDNCFWWISNVFHLQYTPILTLPVNVNAFAACWDRDMYYLGSCYKNAYVSLDNIQKYVETI